MARGHRITILGHHAPPEVPRRKPFASLLTAIAIMGSSLTLSAVSATAQTRFEWPDTTVQVTQYTNAEECLAAAHRVQRGVDKQEELRRWRDTMPSDPRWALAPAPALVTETAARCAARFAEPTVDLHEFAAFLELYLLAGRDADAAALVARRLATLPAERKNERAAVSDSAVQIYLRARPMRLVAAEDILLRRGRGSTDRVERMKLYAELMNAAKLAGDTARARRAAQWVVSVADSLTKAERESEEFESLAGGSGGQLVVYKALDLLVGLSVRLDSLRRSTSALAALERSYWARATGERPGAIPLPVGQHAASLVADYWFPSDAAESRRPTAGRVSIVAFFDFAYCHIDGGPCARRLAELRRLGHRFPAVEITIVAPTHGSFMYLPPMGPADEAVLIREWLDAFQVPGVVLGVTSTPFWRLPKPDGRRIERDLPNVSSYRFGKSWPVGSTSAFLVDQDGLVVNTFLLEESELAQLIDVLLHRQGAAD